MCSFAPEGECKYHGVSSGLFTVEDYRMAVKKEGQIESGPLYEKIGV